MMAQSPTVTSDQSELSMRTSTSTHGNHRIEAMRSRLGEWLAQRLGSATVAISDFAKPKSGGRSNETYFFDISWKVDGERRQKNLVLRLKPTSHRLFIDDNFEKQYRILSLLRETTTAPVPKVLWFESDGSVLGAPFFVMEKIEGESPADNPPYKIEGFVRNASVENRRQLWVSSIETLARLHSHTFSAAQLDFLSEPSLGTSGIEQQLTWWRSCLDWAEAGQPHPVAVATWEYLVNNMPRDRPTSLSWGDARLGNMLFRDFQCVAVLDWELVSLGGAMHDLGYWLAYEHYNAHPSLPGLGSRSETIETWERFSGRRAVDLAWYEAFGCFRLLVIIIRACRMRREAGLRVGYPDFEFNNRCTHRLAELLQLPPPGKLPE